MIYSHKKLVFSISVAVLLLLVMGSFAWQSFSQHALNEKSGTNEVGGRVHDDYQKKTMTRITSNNQSNKDVYAENYGTQPLVVRIKLSEYYQGNGQSLVEGTKKENRETWTPYGSEKSEWYRQYTTMRFGGDKIYLPTFNQDTLSQATDAAGDAIDYMTGTQTALGDGSQTYFTLNQMVANPNNATEQHKAKSTLKENRTVLTMEEWISLPKNQQMGSYWVLDNDGWAYWAEMLQPGEATSLLLTSVEWKESGLASWDDWYYGIDVKGEFSTNHDKKTFLSSKSGSPSENGWALILQITPSQAMTEGEIFDFYGESYIFLKDLGEGNKLILRKESLPQTVTTTYSYTDGPLDQAMKVYYEGLNEKAKVEVQPVQRTFILGMANETEAGLDSNRFLAILAPNDRTTVDPKGEKKAFALSLADVTSVSGYGQAFPTSVSRSAKPTGSNEYSTWWLRTPYSATYGTKSRLLLEPGQLTNVMNTGKAYVRPALVIRR